MALRISKANKEILATMVLTHRVAVRTLATTPSADDNWMDAIDHESVTQFALDVALGDDAPYKLQYLRDNESTAAWVARYRLEQLGVVV